MGRRKADGSDTTTGRGVYSRAYESGRATLFVHFTWRGELIREPLKLDDTPKNRRYAEGLRAEIRRAIALDTFKLAEYFPNSRRIAQGPADPAKATIEDKLKDYLASCRKAVALSKMSAATLASYGKVVNGLLIPKWGKKRFAELTKADMRAWVQLLEGTRKTIGNQLIPLRAILDDAVTDDVIEFSPLAELRLERILDKTAKLSTYKPEPFDPAEVRAILNAAGADRPLVQFALFTGTRTSEYIALDWPAVNLAAGTALIDKVRVARVDQDRTKTKAGTRTIDLMPPALAALQAQRAVSQLAGKRVFLLNGEPWNGDKRVREHWISILKRAKVRYRNPYQTRHTFATMQLTLGEIPLRVAHLLGHVDTEMVNRHYARWIGVDTATVRREWEVLIAELAPATVRKSA